MKKIIPLLLIITLLFSSCDLSFFKKKDEPAAKKEALTEITGADFSASGIVDSAFSADTLAFIVFESDDNLSEDRPENDIGGYYYLYTVDSENGEIKGKTRLDKIDILFPSGIEFLPDGNIECFGFSDPESEKLISVTVSTLSFEQVGSSKPYNSKLPEIDSRNTATGFSFYEGEEISSFFCDDLPDGPLTAFCFREDTDKVIFTNGLDFSDINCNAGSKKIISRHYEYDENGESESETFFIYDLENSLLVNSLTIGEKEDSTVNYFDFCDEYAFFIKETLDENEREGVSFEFFIWNYNIDPVNEKIETEVLSSSELNEKIDSLRRDIKSAYGIDVYINSEDFDFYEEGEDYYLSREAVPIDSFMLITRIKAFLDLLPEGFVRESYSGMENYSFSGFDIFIGDSIQGDAGAYEMQFLDKLTIVFSTSSTDMRTVAHEFMHAFDTRIDDSLSDTSLFDEWNSFNPEGFEYSGLESEDSYENYEKYDPYFSSAYAMKTDAEDRAELFSMLFKAYIDKDYSPYWLDEKEPVRQKAQFLIKLIRDAFPSMKNVGTAPWEELIQKETDNTESSDERQ